MAAKPNSLSRNALIEAGDLQTGDTSSNMLDELSAAGYITPYIPFGKKRKDSIYKLTDEFSL